MKILNFLLFCQFYQRCWQNNVVKINIKKHFWLLLSRSYIGWEEITDMKNKTHSVVKYLGIDKP